VVWVEVKTNWSDFDTSRRSKRLAREVCTGQDMADIVVVAYPSTGRTVFAEEDVMELIRLQTQGVLVVPWVASFTYWDNIRDVLACPSNQRRAVAGSDYRKPRTALAGLPGVGAKTEAKLLEFYGSAQVALLAYGSGGWGRVVGNTKFQRIESACRGQVLGV